MTLAPVALFACYRPDHAARALESLRACPQASQTELYLFADAAPNSSREAGVAQTRRVLRQVRGFGNVELIEQEQNLGLSRSILAGVDRLCASHGRVIVVEDDLILSPHFLGYMNAALDRYETEEQVMQVAGYMFPTDTGSIVEDAVFLPLTTSWGWATWARAWKYMDREMRGFDSLAANARLRRRFDLDGRYPYFDMLQRQRNGIVDSWAIRWYLTCFLMDALVVYPKVSLVANGGMDGSGTHCGTSEVADNVALLLQTPVATWPDKVAQSPIFEAVKAQIGYSQGSSPRTRLASQMALRLARLAKNFMNGK